MFHIKILKSIGGKMTMENPAAMDMNKKTCISELHDAKLLSDDTIYR